MTIQQISTPGGSKHNEDLIAVYENDGLTDIIVMDGATSVADQNYIDSDVGDVAWFTQHFAQVLGRTLSRERTQGESVSLAINELYALFRVQARGVPIPLYAYPIAAMSWIRIIETDDVITLKIYCLGDCKTLLLTPDKRVVDLDPYVNPQEAVLRDEIQKLSQEGVVDATARTARLMPMLRARREFMNSCEKPFVLCLKPDAAFDARENAIHAAPASMLLVMTDGFFRIVDTYHLRSMEQLASMCRHGGLATVMDELRSFERACLGSPALTVKRSDDASAVTWRSSPVRA